MRLAGLSCSAFLRSSGPLINITKLDVLDGFPELKVCVG
jgi:adenylosuccinate synthase